MGNYNKKIMKAYEVYKKRLERYNLVVKLLLESTLNNRSIAKTANCSVGTVQNIRAGRTKKPVWMEKDQIEIDEDLYSQNFTSQPDILYRCPECGALINTKKCLGCYIKKETGKNE